MEDDWIFKELRGTESSSGCKMKEDARTQRNSLDLLARGPVNQKEVTGEDSVLNIIKKGTENRGE